MYCERTVSQRVQIPPRFTGQLDRAREISRALPYLLRDRKLADGSSVQAVLSWETRRMAAVEPHGANLVDFMVDARVQAVHPQADLVVRCLRVKTVAGEALIGTALGATVRVPGVGPLLRKFLML